MQRRSLMTVVLCVMAGLLVPIFGGVASAVLPDVVAAGKIVFQRKAAAASVSEIWVMNADGSNQVQLTSNSVDDITPAWSPDGTQIAFASTRAEPSGNDGNADMDIYVMNADGTGVTLLTNDHTNSVPQGDRFPTWSPDGTQIAWMRFIPGENMDLFAMSSSGVTVTDNGACDCGSIPIRITSRLGEESSPDWEPGDDGDEIVYHRKQNDGTDQDCPDSPGNMFCWDIYRVVVDNGQTPVQLTNTLDAYDGTATWSPDAQEITFRRASSTMNNEVFVFDRDGGSEIRITFATYADNTPDWAPDGTRIAFSSNRAASGSSSDFDIWGMYADGSGQRQLTSGTDDDREPDWQPLMCTVIGTASGETLNGTTGDDVICGLGGNDTLNGSDGNDILIGGSDNDTYNGGNGNDYFDEEAATSGADIFNGNAGTDTLSYALRTNAVTVKQNGSADDGETGEGDSVKSDIEVAVGGTGGDTMNGDTNVNTYYGTGGNDSQSGFGANDVLDPGGGADTVNGGNDNDTINAVDGTGGNDSLDGASGTDSCTADAGDTLSNCP